MFGKHLLEEELFEWLVEILYEIIVGNLRVKRTIPEFQYRESYYP